MGLHFFTQYSSKFTNIIARKIYVTRSDIFICFERGYIVEKYIRAKYLLFTSTNQGILADFW